MSDFDQNWKNFLESFDEAFDTDELNEKISEIVVKEHPDATPAVSYTHLTLPTKLEV